MLAFLFSLTMKLPRRVGLLVLRSRLRLAESYTMALLERPQSTCILSSVAFRRTPIWPMTRREEGSTNLNVWEPGEQVWTTN